MQHLPWLFILLSLASATIDAASKPKTMITATNTSKPGCQRKCGNLTIPYPFGIGSDCFLRVDFGIICNTSYNPPRAFPVIPYGWDILDITESQLVIRNTEIASVCYDSQGKVISNDTGFLNMSGSSFTISHTANKITVIGCNNYGVFGGSDKDARLYERAGCIALCNNITEAVPGSCPGSGCCQTSAPIGWQDFSVYTMKVEETQETSLGPFLSDQSCGYAFFAKNGSYTFGGASDLSISSGVQNRIMEQVPMVLDWSIELNISCKEAKKLNTSSDQYLCQSNSQCIETDAGGYRCSCLPGYEGNPYLKPGCTDIKAAGPNTSCRSVICYGEVGHFSKNCFYDDGKNGCKKRQQSSATILKKLILGLGILGISFVITILIILGWWFSSILKRRRIIKQKARYYERNGGLLLEQHMATNENVVALVKIFTIYELERATDHFNDDRVLGRGGQGVVYKGMLGEGRIVAIKSCKVVDERQCTDFINEVIILSQINHRNIVKLLGCCLETEVPLQVYEFIPNGTLYHHIHHPNEDFPITWKMRLQIASDAAGALAFLHSSSSIPIFHRDIKSSNILLDEKYRAKLSDFGTSKSIAVDQTHASNTRVMGTFGYLDPEYFILGQFTEKSDVYSFGVVLVELLTGQKAVRSAIEEERSLTSWFISHMENSCLLDIIDSQILQEGSTGEFSVIANVAKQCLNSDRNSRPTMKVVLLEIEAVLSLHFPNAREDDLPKSEQTVAGITRSSDDVSSFSSFYLDNCSSSSAEVSLLFNDK